MTAFRFSNVAIESFAFDRPPHEVTSLEIEDKIAHLYEKLKVPFGTLEKLSGVQSRRFYDDTERPSVVATRAAEAALDQMQLDRENIGIVVNCSVNRDYFEPATAVLVHNNLGLPETSMAFDITNACVGFSNGIAILGNLIETGVVKAGLLISGENNANITNATFRLMQDNPEMNREELLKLMPTFTLGSGATAMVLCHKDLASTSHRLHGCVAHSASVHHELCKGNGDFCFLHDPDQLNPIMETQSQKLISSAAKLGKRTWEMASEVFGWSADTIDKIICHQVGKQVNSIFYNTIGLPIEKEFTVYEKLGNLVSAALPSALISAAEEEVLKENDKVLLMGFGSGLNSTFSAVTW